MTLIIVSFVAGLLTVLAPCVLPLLPVIIGGSASGARNKLKPFIIIGALSVSIILFTLVVKLSTTFIGLPQSFWPIFSGMILLVFALSMIFPNQWGKVAHKFKLEGGGNKLLAKGHKRQGFTGDAIMGLALGPVFTSCSPTYLVILSVVLPQSFATGLVNLIAYTIGLALILLLIAILGQRFVLKLGLLSNPNGWFKKVIGWLFLLLAIAIMTGLEKDFETWLVESGYIPTAEFETKLLEDTGIFDQ
jgi:cytochrome c-type biogenesis protein